MPTQMEEDRAAIQTLYQNRGFADVDVEEIQTQPLSGEGVELVVTIREGTQYRINEVRVDGVNIVPQVKWRLPKAWPHLRAKQSLLSILPYCSIAPTLKTIKLDLVAPR